MAENPMLIAQMHVSTFRHLASTGQVAWTSMPVPKPGAMRAFQGLSGKNYTVLVCQANVVAGTGSRIVHEGALTTASGMIVHLTPEIADELYHLAAANKN